MDKILALAVEHLANYLEVFFSTLKSPGTALQPVTTPIEEFIRLKDDSAEPQYQRQLSPRAISFLLISIFVGSVLNANIVRRLPAPDLMLTAVVVLVLWIVLSSFVHLLCKFLGGRGSFTQTLSASLQVFAVCYVLSSCVAFLWGVLSIKIIVSGAWPSGVVWRLVQEPILTYFLSQLLLIAVYLTLAMRRVHGFGPRRSLSGTWSFLEPIAFSIIFLVLTFGIVALSKSTYDVHRIPLTDPESQINKFEAGALVIFEGGIGHVGVIADEHGFYRTSPRHGVIYSEFGEYWSKRIKGFKRVTGGCEQVLGPTEVELCAALRKARPKCTGYGFETWECEIESVLL